MTWGNETGSRQERRTPEEKKSCNADEGLGKKGHHTGTCLEIGGVLR